MIFFLLFLYKRGMGECFLSHSFLKGVHGARKNASQNAGRCGRWRHRKEALCNGRLRRKLEGAERVFLHRALGRPAPWLGSSCTVARDALHHGTQGQTPRYAGPDTTMYAASQRGVCRLTAWCVPPRSVVSGTPQRSVWHPATKKKISRRRRCC